MAIILHVARVFMRESWHSMY